MAEKSYHLVYLQKRERFILYFTRNRRNQDAVVGPFKKGPWCTQLIVNTQSEFEEIFGTPDETYHTGYTYKII